MPLREASIAASVTVLLLFALAGCPGNPSGTGSTTASHPGTEQAASVSSGESTEKGKSGTHTHEKVPADLLSNWHKPALAFLLTGEQYGYIEPCGCTEHQSGGISRRADLFRQLRERGWPTVALDLGGVVQRSRRQSEIKFESILAAMKEMGYAAVALGPQEFRLGPAYLLSQHQPGEEGNPGVAFLSANAVLFESPDLGTPLRTKLIEAGDLKIGVTAIIGPNLADKVLPDNATSDIKFLPADEPLAAAIGSLKEQNADLLVLLSHANHTETERIVKKFPQFDLVVSAGGPEDGEDKPETIGTTMIVDVGHKGKHVGVVGYFPDDREHRLRFELVTVDQERFHDTPAMIEQMRYYQKRLKEQQIVAVEHLEHSIPHPSGARFVGAAKCGECHARAYEKWEKTPHAHAFESLKHARKDQPDYGISRVYDPECLSCHVTGWEPQKVLRYESGFVNEEFARNDAERQMAELLQGQQCESCHGPGSRHIELLDAGETDKAMAEVRVTLKQAKQSVCYECHDLDNSPHFDFEKYWKKVAHPWRD